MRMMRGVARGSLMFLLLGPRLHGGCSSSDCSLFLLLLFLRVPGPGDGGDRGFTPRASEGVARVLASVEDQLGISVPFQWLQEVSRESLCDV